MKLEPKNLAVQEYLLPVCRNCTITYHPIMPEGTYEPTWYFIGEAPGFNEDKEGRPFVGEAGKLLRKMIDEAGFTWDNIRIYNSVICRPTDELGSNRTPEASESVPCFNTFARMDIKKTQPKVIIAVGREPFIAMFPEMNRLSMKEMIQITNLTFEGIPVRAIYHTSFINRTGGVHSSYYAPMVNILKEVVGGIKAPTVELPKKLEVICKPKDLALYKEILCSEDRIALDFEGTVSSPYDSDCRLGIIGLANSKIAIAIVCEDPEGTYPIPPDFNELLKEILNRKVLVFNAGYEMPICIRFFDIDLADRIHDLMQTCRAVNLSGGLKNICRLTLNAPVWNSVLAKWTSAWFENSEYLFKKKKSIPKIIDILTTSKSIEITAAYATTKMQEAQAQLDAIPGSSKWTSEVTLLSTVVQVLVTFEQLIKNIPVADKEKLKFYDTFYASLLLSKFETKRWVLDYTHLPIEVVGPYNCCDTGYTYDLDLFLDKKIKEKQCDEAARLYDEHAKLEVELTSAGIIWDDEKASEILRIYDEKALQTLKDLLTHPFLAEQLGLTDPQKLEILSSTKEDKLLKYFNPRSSHKTTREKFSNAIMTKDMKIAMILYLLASDADLMQLIKDKSEIGKEYATLLTYITEDEKLQVAKYKEFYDHLTQGLLPLPTRNEKNLISKANNYQIDGINQGMFEEMFAVFTKFVGINPNKKETWNEEFRLLFLCRLFKKISKGRSAYINGKCGRGQVKVVGTTSAQDDRLPLRIRQYIDGVPKNPSELYLLHPEYKVNDALTKRWKSYIHTIPWNSELRDIHVSRFVNGILCHFDYSQMEVKILARESGDENLINYLKKKGGDIHRYIASKVWGKEEKDITPAERRFAKTSTFAILYGKSLHAFATEIMNGDFTATEALFDSLFTAFPGIKKFIDNKHKEVLEKGEVRTMFGDSIVIPFDPMRVASVNQAKRDAQNYPIQSAASTVAGVSIYRVIKSLQDFGFKARGFGFTHDSGDIDTECGSVIKMLKILPEIAEKAPLELWGVPVSIDIAIGTRGNTMIDLGDIEVDSSLNSFKCTFEGHEHALNDTVRLLKESNFSVDVKVEESEDDYWDMKELFITRRAYSMFIGESRKKLSGELSVSKL